MVDAGDCVSIRQHYKPSNSGEEPPETRESSGSGTPALSTGTAKRSSVRLVAGHQAGESQGMTKEGTLKTLGDFTGSQCRMKMQSNGIQLVFVTVQEVARTP